MGTQEFGEWDLNLYMKVQRRDKVVMKFRVGFRKIEISTGHCSSADAS